MIKIKSVSVVWQGNILPKGLNQPCQSTKADFFMTDININDIPDFELSKEEKENIAKGAAEDTEEKELKEIADNHARQMRVSRTDEMVVDTFPAEPALVVKKLEEYFDEAADLYLKMVNIRNIMDNIQADPFSKWFFIQGHRWKEGERLKYVYEQIKRLRRLKMAYEKKQIETLFKFVKFETKEERKKYNTDTMMAREGLLIDIVSYDGIKLKGTGSRYMGICPFHKESTASFFVYSDNWYHCFGCQAHGNVFNYVMHARGCDFKQALEEVDKFV